MRKTLLIVLVVVCFTIAFATSTAYKFPTTTTNTDYSSGVAWTSPNNVQADDASNASVTLDGDLGQVSDWIYCTGFGFTSSDVPAGSTINGIVVTVNWEHTLTEADLITVQLLKGGSLTGTGKTGGGNNPMSATDFGAGNDVWGSTLSSSDVTASNFGVAIRVTSDNAQGGSQTALVDYVKLGIDYTAPASSVRKRVIQ